MRYPSFIMRFLPEPLPGEVWLQITDLVIPGIEPYYYISNLGRAYCSITNRLVQINYSNTYYNFHVRMIDGTQKKFTLHRTMMLTFKYFPGCEEFQVNHIDGNKLNYSFDNLEWVTPQENVQHAHDTGLCAHGEDHHDAVLTCDQVHDICKLYVDGCYIDEIARMIKCNKNTVKSIIYGDTWKEISSQYNIQIRRFGVFTLHEEYQIVDIFRINNCTILEDSIYYEIYQKLNRVADSNIRRAIGRIFRNYLNGYYNSL